MKSVAVVAVAVLFVVAALDTVEAQSFEFKCKGIDIKLTAEHKAIMGECLKGAGAATIMELNAGKMGCFSKCMMEKNNVVDAAGMPHKENVMKAMDEGLPGELVESWKAAAGECIDSQGGKIKPDDPTCASYLPLTMCIGAAYVNACH